MTFPNEGARVSSDQSAGEELLREAIASLSTPDRVDSPFGALDFFDGLPLPETVSKVYDALDLMRGVEVFLNAVPGASLVAMRRGLQRAGVTSARVVGITEPRANSNSLFLTPNTETTYGTTLLDLRAWGPTAIEAPPRRLDSQQRQQDRRSGVRRPGAGRDRRGLHRQVCGGPVW
jgi:hypothetical protein